MRPPSTNAEPGDENCRRRSVPVGAAVERRRDSEFQRSVQDRARGPSAGRRHHPDRQRTGTGAKLGSSLQVVQIGSRERP